MLTPKYLQDCSLYAEEIAADLRREVIDSIVERILIRRAQGLDYILTSSDINAIEILTESGSLLADIRKQIAKKSGLMSKEITRALKDGGYKSVKYDDEIYKQAGLDPSPINESPQFLRLMQRNAEVTKGTWENFTQTTALESQKLFINSMDKVYNSLNLGLNSLTSAYFKVINDVIQEGPMIVYPSGRKMTLEAATMMCLRTSVAQTAAKVSEIRMDEMGVDLVMISSHLGARPTHQTFQGKIFSRSGNAKSYKPLYAPIDQGGTGYGTVTGLCGANCRHQMFPYVRGITKNHFAKYDAQENQEVYEKTQKQRAIERKVRNLKGEVNSVSKIIDQLPEGDPLRIKYEQEYLKKSERLKGITKEYYNYCKENNLKPLEYRLQIAKESNISKPNISNVAKDSYKDRVAKKKQKQRLTFDRSKYKEYDSPHSNEFRKFEEKYKLVDNKGVSFTKKANQGIVEYSSNYYTDINSALRTGAYAKRKASGNLLYVDHAIDRCSKDIAKFTHTESVHCRRLVGDVSYIFNGFKGQITQQMIDSFIGKEYVEPAFLSARFTLDHYDDMFGDIALEIYAPKGTKCAYIDSFSCFPGEREILFDKGTRFLIRGGGFRDVKDYWGSTWKQLYIELEVIQ